MKKKIFILIAVLLLVSTVLSGCGSSVKPVFVNKEKRYSDNVNVSIRSNRQQIVISLRGTNYFLDSLSRQKVYLYSGANAVAVAPNVFENFQGAHYTCNHYDLLYSYFAVNNTIFGVGSDEEENYSEESFPYVMPVNPNFYRSITIWQDYIYSYKLPEVISLKDAHNNYSVQLYDKSFKPLFNSINAFYTIKNNKYYAYFVIFTINAEPVTMCSCSSHDYILIFRFSSDVKYKDEVNGEIYQYFRNHLIPMSSVDKYLLRKG